MTQRRPDIRHLTRATDGLPEAYRAWIWRFVHENWNWRPERPGMRDRCYFAAHQMTLAFPELQRIEGAGFTRGQFRRTVRQHAWCARRDDGLVVDPTAIQFTLPIAYFTFPRVLGHILGRCPSCGKTQFDRLRHPACCTLSMDDYLQRILAHANPEDLPRSVRRVVTSSRSPSDPSRRSRVLPPSEATA